MGATALVISVNIYAAVEVDPGVNIPLEEEDTQTILIMENNELDSKQTDHGQVFILDSKLFEIGKAVLLPNATHNIEQLVAYMRANPDKKMLVKGYSSSMGNKIHNVELSLNRANMIHALLSERGINPDRIIIQDYEEIKSMVDNNSEESKSTVDNNNSHVEIIILN